MLGPCVWCGLWPPFLFSYSNADTRVGCFTLFVLWLSVFCVCPWRWQWVCLQSIIVAVPGHTHLRFNVFPVHSTEGY